MMNGDFTAFASPACNGGRQLTLAGPFTGNRIDPSRLSRAAFNIAAKLPRTDDPCGRVTFRNIIRTNNHQPVGKVDYQVSTTHSIFARYMATTDAAPVPYALTGNLLTTFFGGRDNLAQSYTLDDNYLINANTVNSLRLAVNRTAIHRLNASFFNAPSVGINNFSYLPDYLIVSVGGGFNIGNGVQTNSTFRTSSLQRFLQGVKSSVFKNAPAGFYYPGDPGFPSMAGIYKRWADVAPRVGIAWPFPEERSGQQPHQSYVWTGSSSG